MSDLTRWDLRGPARTLRTEFAEWNHETGDWRRLATQSVATFRDDGQLSETEFHNPDGSVPRQVRVYDSAGRLIEEQSWTNDDLTGRVVHTYDEVGRAASVVIVDADGTTHEIERCEYGPGGRKTKVASLPAAPINGATCSTGPCGPLYGVEGTDVAYAAPGATTCTTMYDDHGRPSEVVFSDASAALVSRLVFSRAEDGRLLSERLEVAAPGELPGLMQGADVRAGERASMAELLKSVIADQTFSVATYAYDDNGRRVETLRRVGRLAEERVRVRYDDLGNPSHEVRVDVHREMRMEDGVVKTEEKSSAVQHARFEYRYDAHGNWIERIVLQRIEPDTVERPSNIQRRTITYYGGRS